MTPPEIDPLPSSPHAGLFRRIAAYYHYNSVLHLNDGDTLTGALGQYDIVIAAPTPAGWLQQATNALPLLADGGMFVLTRIHSTAQHADAWHTVHTSPDVMMSIDMFHTGFIFKSPSFLRKQHFVVR